jgi:hypothetical protein
MSRAITLTKLKKITTCKIQGALKEQISQHNETVFTKSRAITLQIPDKSTIDTQGAELQIPTNISVNDSRLNAF